MGQGGRGERIVGQGGRDKGRGGAGRKGRVGQSGRG